MRGLAGAAEEVRHAGCRTCGAADGEHIGGDDGGKLIFSVRNPVAEKVEVVEGTGLSNVKAVADKYGGDFAVSCDAEKFQAVVML